tara:strand:+ start:1848 stop:2213 length:366 start_codon:yes stop_codon:yes gene_type:complete
MREVLKNRVIGEKDAVMFDIDDTLIFTSGVANVEMIQLLYYARNLGYKIVIITARPTNELTARITKIQLQKYKIPYDFLYITPAENKGNVKVQTGLNYILSVGDQETDLTNTLHAIKIHIN